MDVLAVRTRSSPPRLQATNSCPYCFLLSSRCCSSTNPGLRSDARARLSAAHLQQTGILLLRHLKLNGLVLWSVLFLARLQMSQLSGVWQHTRVSPPLCSNSPSTNGHRLTYARQSRVFARQSRVFGIRVRMRIRIRILRTRFWVRRNTNTHTLIPARDPRRTNRPRATPIALPVCLLPST